jgi:hypothetical protein
LGQAVTQTASIDRGSSGTRRKGTEGAGHRRPAIELN